MHLYCAEDLKKIMDTINRVSDTRLNFSIHWHFTDPEKKTLLFEDQKLRVYSFPLKHRIACTGFLFEEKPLPRKIDKDKLERLHISVADILRLKAGMDVVNESGETILNADATLDPPPPRSYAYCSDTRFDRQLANYFSQVDLLYHESTFLDDHADRADKTYHSTARQAAEIAVMTQAKQLLLGHFSARYASLEPFVREAGQVFGNCILATDGKKIKI